MRQIDRAPVPGAAYRILCGSLTSAEPVPPLEEAARRGIAIHDMHVGLAPFALSNAPLPPCYVQRDDAPHGMVSYEFRLVDFTVIYRN